MQQSGECGAHGHHHMEYMQGTTDAYYENIAKATYGLTAPGGDAPEGLRRRGHRRVPVYVREEAECAPHDGGRSAHRLTDECRQGGDSRVLHQSRLDGCEPIVITSVYLPHRRS